MRFQRFLYEHFLESILKLNADALGFFLSTMEGFHFKTQPGCFAFFKIDYLVFCLKFFF
jgi:hypothetical protein